MSLEKFVAKLSPNRQLLASILLEKEWFRNSDISIQKHVLTLPDDHEAFVYDLSQRPDRIGQLKINKLVKIVSGDYLITPVFEVYTKTSRKTFTKEYVSWKMGRTPGLKGLLLVETKGKISHFITIETEKFAYGEVTFDAIGGLFQYTKEEIVDLPSQVNLIIKNKLGLSKLSIKKYLDLGHIQSDNGLTVNYPGIFAAIIDGSDAKQLKNIKTVSSDKETSAFKISVVPVGQLEMYLNRVDDAFFLSIIARLLAKKVISL